MNVPPRGDAFKRVGAFFAQLQVTQQAIPNLTLRVSEGSYYNGNTVVEFAGGNTPTFTVPGAGLAKWGLVSLTGAGSIQIVYGGAATSNPPTPAVPAGMFPLVYVYIVNGTTALTTDMIFDQRPLWTISSAYLPLIGGTLTGPLLLAADPTAALGAATKQYVDSGLALKPSFVDLSNGLLSKANTTGTIAEDFKLNQDWVGAPSSNVTFSVERGTQPDTEIRWNEGSDIWEFTNNGSTYQPIPTAVDIALAVSGTFVDVSGDTMTGALSMGGNKITSLGTPTVATDAVNKTYVDTILASSYQPLSSVLTGLASLAGPTGIVVETSANVFTNRSILGTASNISVTDGNGVSGNPTIDLVNAGTAVSNLFVKITTDAKGRVTGTTAVVTADITALVSGTYVDVAGDTMTGALVMPVGSAGAPSVTFTGDLDSGMYSSGANEVSFAVGGVQKARVDASGITVFSGFFTPGTGGAAAPEYTFTGDTDTGMYHPAANQVALAAAGANVATFSASGLTLTTDLAVTEGGTGASTASGAATNLGLGTGDSPQFTAVNVGHASDTTITRVSAGVIAVEGSNVLMASNIGVAVQAWDMGLDELAALATNGNVRRTAGAFVVGAVDLTADVTGDLPYSNLAQGSARSVLGVTGNATADVASIQGTANQVLVVNGAGTALAFSSLDLAQAATVGVSVLGVANGGSGVSTTPTNGQLLIGNGTGYTVAALTAGVGVSVTNAAGSITVATQTLKNTQTFTFGAIAANDVGDSTNTVTVTGAVAGDVVTLGLPATLPTGFTYVGYVSAADTVTIRAHGSASSGVGANAAGAAISVIVMKYASF